MYATRGTTDLPLQGIAFTTDGVKDFMGMVMGVDTNDFVSKMEGFAVQGIKGTYLPHRKRSTEPYTVIRCSAEPPAKGLKHPQFHSNYYQLQTT